MIVITLAKCAMINPDKKKKPTETSGTYIFVLSADILDHFVVKDIKIFTCFCDFFAIAKTNEEPRFA
ncbi:MAG: hypothetical protein DCE90_11950 [Pseudanabaena sp.]|nr:MAG: hypothetical protein DCE90_11950 [Pseudanabaena sp.]